MYKGIWDHPYKIESVPVAVKSLKTEASEIEKVKFLQEAAISAQFKHPNIINPYGVVTLEDPVSVI